MSKIIANPTIAKTLAFVAPPNVTTKSFARAMLNQLNTTYVRAEKHNRLKTAIESRRKHPRMGQPMGRSEIDGWAADLETLLMAHGVFHIKHDKIKANLEEYFAEAEIPVQ